MVCRYLIINKSNMKEQRTVAQGEYFKHYKGGIYQVLGIGVDTLSGGRTVIYQNTSGEIFTRLIREFLEEVDNTKGSATKYRFEKIDSILREHNEDVNAFLKTLLQDKEAKTKETIFKIAEEDKAFAEFSKSIGVNIPEAVDWEVYCKSLDQAKEDFKTTVNLKPEELVYNCSQKEFITCEDGSKLEVMVVEPSNFKTTLNFGGVVQEQPTEDTPQKKEDTVTQKYVRKEVVEAKRVTVSDCQFIRSEFFVLAPKKLGGKVKNQKAKPKLDYLIIGEGYAKVVSKETFEEKYKLEIPF